MSRSILLPLGADVIGAVCDMIDASEAPLRKILVIFPSRRPKIMLFRELARRRGRAMEAPACFSIGDWVERCAGELGYGRTIMDAADGAALIHQLHPEQRLPGGGRELSLEAFLSWGFTLFSDFEELKSEEVSPKALEAVKALAQEPLTASFGSQLEHLGEWYRGFYHVLEARGLSTPASTVSHVAERADRIDLSGYEQVIAAGFYAVTRCEQRILKALLGHKNSALILRDGPGIERTIKQLGVEPQRTGAARPSPRIEHLRAADSHGQVMALSRRLAPGPGLSDTVLVLAKQDTVFPVIHHLLPRLGEDWNISMGYPLTRTPIWSLLEALAAAHEGRQDGAYFLPQYLRLMLHPYVKNLSLGSASYPTRILLHAVEEALNKKSRRMVRPRQIASDPEVRQEVDRRLAGADLMGAGLEQMYRHLESLHDLVIGPFEKISSVADFARKTAAVVSAVAEHGTAGRHPFAERFFYRMTGVLEQLETCLMAGQRFDSVCTYFGLLKHFAAQASVPFPGTPLRGLQVLGFMETRNLTFKRVLVMDANEGQLPAVNSVDTILPQALRAELGLPTSADRELVDRYHFRNLVAGSEEAVLCYSQGGGAQKSRFLEQLEWEEEKAEGRLKKERGHLAYFTASFSQDDPKPVAKTQEMMEAISGLRYSATMLDCYLHCGLRFCHRYLMRIREKDQVMPDVDSGDIGGAVHDSLKRFFGRRLKTAFNYHKGMDREMGEAVEQAFQKIYGHNQDGNIHLIKSQAKTRLAQFLEYQASSLPDLLVESVELELAPTVEVPGAGLVPAFGILDRVDRRGDQTVIVDYKTGYGETPSFDNFLAEGRPGWAHWLRSVQLPFYVMLYLAHHPEASAGSVNSELLKLGGRGFERKPLFPDGSDREGMYRAYLEAIGALICEIRDPGLPFADAWDPSRECPGCPYQLMCGRQWAGEGHR